MLVALVNGMDELSSELLSRPGSQCVLPNWNVRKAYRNVPWRYSVTRVIRKTRGDGEREGRICSGVGVVVDGVGL